MSKNLTIKWVSNFFFVAIQYFSNYILLIIIFPFLVKKLGISTFGSLNFILTIMNFLVVFIDYGFNISSIKSISLNWDDKSFVNKVVSNVYSIKLILYACFVVIILISVSFSKQLQKESLAIYSGLFYVFGLITFPTWFFQAVQNLKQVTVLNLLFKLFALVLILILVEKPSDNYWFFILLGSANMLTSIYSMFILKTNYGISYIKPNLDTVIAILINDFPLLISNILAVVLLSSNTIILKFTVTEQQLGLYSVSERILYALWQVLSVFAVSIYPYLCKFTNEPFSELKRFLTKTYLPFLGAIILMSLFIVFFSENIITILFSSSINSNNLLISSNLLKFMMLIFVLACTNIPAHQTLLAYGYKNICTIIFIFTVIFNILLGILFSKFFGVFGITISFSITLFLLSLAFNLTVLKKLKF